CSLRHAGDDHGPPPGRAAMLHPAHDLLANIAALLEVEAAEKVHPDIVREHVVDAEILAKGSDPRGNPSRAIGAAGGVAVADLCRVLHLDEPDAEPAGTFVAIGEQRLIGRWIVGRPEYRKFRQRLDLDLCPEPVELHALDEIGNQIRSQREPERAIRLGHEPFDLDFTLRAEQGKPAACTLEAVIEAAGQRVVEELSRIRPGDAHHTLSWKAVNGHASTVFDLEEGSCRTGGAPSGCVQALPAF